MGGCSFDSKDALDGLFTEDCVAEASGYVRELLVISPFDLPFVTSIVIIVARCWPILKRLLVVDLLSLGVPHAVWLPPSVIELKVHVVQMVVDFLLVSYLVQVAGDVALLVEVLGSDLCDVHVDQISIVTVNLHHLVLVIAIDINVVARRNVLMSQDDAWLSELVTRGIHVPNLHVTALLLLINLKEEVLFGYDLLISALSKLLTIMLVLELDETNLLLNNFIDAFANILEMFGAAGLAQFCVGTGNCRVILECLEICGLRFILCGFLHLSMG